MKIQSVLLDDWEALYFDGKLYCQNHTLETKSILSALAEYTLEVGPIDKIEIQPQIEIEDEDLFVDLPKTIEEVLVKIT